MKLQHRILHAVTVLYFFAFAVIFGALPAVAQDAQGILDGKIFVGDIGDKGKAASDQDEINFKNGKFHSVGCDQWGFGDAPYTARKDGNTIRFHAITVSPTDGKIEWDGVVKGDSLEAKYVWTKERWYWKDAHEEKWFKGNLKD